MRRPRSLALALVAALLTHPAPIGVAAARAATCYPPPVDARVRRAFVEPPCEYCAGGHRGLDFATRPGQVVTAVSPGTATFVGLVARIRYVVVAQDDGLRATYGRLASTSIRQGSRVARGTRLGTSTDVLFFGLRDGDRYLDPEPRLGTWRRRPRLVPIDGTPARPGPPPQLVCRKPRTPR